MNIILLLVPILFQLSYSFGQDIDDQILSTIFTDTALIKNQGILSLHVYSEMTEKNHDGTGNYVIAKKRSEIEFNAHGLPSYERNDFILARSHALGDTKTRHISYVYDDKQRIISSCNKAQWYSSCQYISYNSEGNITSLRSDGSSGSNGLMTFEWENGEMIEAKSSADEETDYFFERNYDKQGRISEMRQGNGHLTTYNYTDNGVEIRIVYASYREDSLISKNIITKRNDTDQITYSCKINGKLDTISETIASYNEVNDLILLQHTDNSDRLHSKYRGFMPAPIQSVESSEQIPVIEPSRITVYTIENVYENELLTKRVINLTEDNGYNEYKRVLVERFVYEKTALLDKSWPSDEEY